MKQSMPSARIFQLSWAKMQIGVGPLAFGISETSPCLVTQQIAMVETWPLLQKM
jgi:hypothetical protein